MDEVISTLVVVTGVDEGKGKGKGEIRTPLVGDAMAVLILTLSILCLENYPWSEITHTNFTDSYRKNTDLESKHLFESTNFH